MNKIVNKFLLAGDKFMPQEHSVQLEFTYSVCGPFAKNKERVQKYKEIVDLRYIYQNEDFKDWTERTTSDKILSDKTCNTAKNQKFDGYQHELALIFYKTF